MQNISALQVPTTKAPVEPQAPLAPTAPLTVAKPSASPTAVQPVKTDQGAAQTAPQSNMGYLPVGYPPNGSAFPKGFDQSGEGKDLLRRLEEYQVKEMRRRLDLDLSDIKAAYPDVSAKDVRELGELYLSIMKAGGVDAVSAYEAQMLFARRKMKGAPPVIGAVNTSGTREKDFYSPNEVDRLTDKDFDKNPKLLSLVLKSMTKWK